MTTATITRTEMVLHTDDERLAARIDASRRSMDPRDEDLEYQDAMARAMADPYSYSW